VKHHAAIGEACIFPFAALAAVAKQAIFKGAGIKQLTVKPYRLLTVHFILHFFHRRSDPSASPDLWALCLRNALMISESTVRRPRPATHLQHAHLPATQTMGGNWMRISHACFHG